MEEILFRLKTLAFMFLHVQHMRVGLCENSFLLVEQPGQVRLGHFPALWPHSDSVSRP